MPTTTPENVGISSERLERIAPAMQSWIEQGTISGASMMIARRGQLVYDENIGHLYKDGQTPVASDSIFRIYSMTKPIICTALMTFYEEGRFQLKTPLARFIPMLGDLKVHQTDESGNASEVAATWPITVGALMSHTAGFTYDFLFDSPVCELYRQARIGNNAGRTLEQFVKDLATLPLAYQPDSTWHYSVSIDVAAYLLQVLADKPLRDVLQERIFTPLGMSDTDFCVPEEKLPRLAGMYGVGDLVAPDMTLITMFNNWQNGVHEELDVSKTYPTDNPAVFQRGGHGLYSTPQDYMRFAMMLYHNGILDGQRILGRKTLELMHANSVPANLMPLMLGGIPMSGYGFGMGSRAMMDVGLAGMPGSVGEYGWAGAATTYYWVDPVEEMVGLGRIEGKTEEMESWQRRGRRVES
ncbi:MAG: serine hydrolase domain-containing protein [Chloroflexota bacterium]